MQNSGHIIIRQSSMQQQPLSVGASLSRVPPGSHRVRFHSEVVSNRVSNVDIDTLP